jgi:hypothetical protein
MSAVPAHPPDATHASRALPNPPRLDALSSSVAFRLNALIPLLVAGFLSLSAVYDYVRARDDHFTEVDRQVSAALSRSMKSLPGPVWNFDTAQVAQIIAAEMEAPFVLGMDVTSGGKSVAAVSRDGAGQLQSAPVVQKAEYVAITIADISRVSDHQASKLGEISRSIGDIEQATKSNGALVEEGSAAASSLRDQAYALLVITQTFKLHPIF